MLKPTLTLDNKTIPSSIREEAIKALQYFPELYDCEITFKFKENIKKSTMQAQPIISSLFGKKEDRKYIILISKKIQIDTEELSIFDIPSKVMVGWLGHELGHIMDYRSRGFFNMLVFGFKYLYSDAHIKEVERAADVFAIQHGMVDYILETKNFILNHASISEKYKAKLKRLYLSPEEIMHIVNESA
ncbi:hypothetical protein [Patiriisocius hiemis]|uniref:Uncharacterized protein n=1 Tax=Patiriisocius hiemis TaxID=3075604 RepID=A0ABU2Y8Z8_9FLAO|nr:hypothetical protein [Constantimarinum sp. W242]MDT0554647.1 hypothetical protein [Constantimarinum sp. W242]